jgi:hypothetical protein
MGKSVHNTAVHNARSSLDTVRFIKLKLFLQIAHKEKIRNSYKILVGKPDGKRLLGKSRSRWEEKMKIYI